MYACVLKGSLPGSNLWRLVWSGTPGERISWRLARVVRVEDLGQIKWWKWNRKLFPWVCVCYMYKGEFRENFFHKNYCKVFISDTSSGIVLTHFAVARWRGLDIQMAVSQTPPFPPPEGTVAVWILFSYLTVDIWCL